MNISYPQCGGCGAPRQALSPWCRYCASWIGTEHELARAVAAIRTRMPTVQVPARPAPPRPRVAPAPSVSVLDFLWTWTINVICVGIFGVPVVLMLWAILTAAMSQ